MGGRVKKSNNAWVTKNMYITIVFFLCFFYLAGVFPVIFYFSHRRSAWIKQSFTGIFCRLKWRKNLFIKILSESHFGASWWSFCILQAVWCCMHCTLWRSAPVTTMPVFFITIIFFRGVCLSSTGLVSHSVCLLSSVFCLSVTLFMKLHFVQFFKVL